MMPMLPSTALTCASASRQGIAAAWSMAWAQERWTRSLLQTSSTKGAAHLVEALPPEPVCLAPGRVLAGLNARETWAVSLVFGENAA